MVNVAIYGAGAAGIVIGSRLHKGGANVTLIARDQTYDTIKQEGAIVSNGNGEEETFNFAVTDQPKDINNPDYILIATKAYAIPSIAHNINTMVGDKTTVIPLCNGVPWWFFQKHEGLLSGKSFD